MAMNMMREAAESLVERFNRLYPANSPVLLIKDLGEVVETTVKWPAEVTVNGPMIGLSGLAGKWLLNRVIPKTIPSCDDPSPAACSWWHENAFAETSIEEGIDGPIVITQGPVQVVLDDDLALEFIRVKFGFDDKNTILDILGQWQDDQTK